MIITITALAVLLFAICFKSVEFFEKSKLWLHYLLHLLLFAYLIYVLIKLEKF
jgi:hypothetical protein